MNDPASSVRPDADVAVSRSVVLSYERIGTWARLIGVVGMLVSLGLISLVVFATASMSVELKMALMPVAGGVAMVTVVVLALLTLLPSIILNRYASAISRLVRTKSRVALNDVVKRQYAAWISVAVYAVLYLVTQILALIPKLPSR